MYRDTAADAAHRPQPSTVSPVFQQNGQISSLGATFQRGPETTVPDFPAGVNATRPGRAQLGDRRVVARDDDGLAGFGRGNGGRQPGLQILN